MDARQRIDLVMQGYRSSIALLTASKVGLFGELGDGTREPADLAASLGMDARAVDQVLHALAADGWLERLPDGRFRVAEEYRPLLLPTGERTMASIINHNHTCMQRWAELDRVLETGTPAPSSGGQRSERQWRDFILGMENISRRSSMEVMRVLDLSRFRKMLDLGGGPGTAAICFAREHEQLHAVVFDLPIPVGIAEEQIAGAGLVDRVTTRAGDYFVDELGSGYDLVYVSNIIHSMSPDDCAGLFAKCCRALEPGGMLIVKEFFLEDDRTSPAIAALFSLNMLVHTEGGKSYTWSETEALLERAGLTSFERHPVAVASGILTAVKI